MATSKKRLLVDNPLRTEQAAHERLSKKTALAVFSSDALSSTAYATEEIMLVLAAAVAFDQAYAFRYVVPVSIGIAVLLVGGNSYCIIKARSCLKAPCSSERAWSSSACHTILSTNVRGLLSRAASGLQ